MQIDYQGRKVEARIIPFTTRKEDFGEYKLVDGTILRVKLVVTQIIKLEGIQNPDGTQAYGVNHQTVIAPVEENSG